jgi:hypothetical protein
MNEVYFTIAIVAVAAVAGIMTWVAYMVGHAAGYYKHFDEVNRAVVNEIYKGRARGGAVPEFIAPVDHAVRPLRPFGPTKP